VSCKAIGVVTLCARAQEARMLAQLLLVFAFVFAVIAALFMTQMNRPPINVHFGWLAVAFWILSLLLGGWAR
jgi:hypothetical protein